MGKTRSLSDRLRTRTYVQTDTSPLVVAVGRQTRRPTLLETHEVESCFIYLNLLSIAALKVKGGNKNRAAASIGNLENCILLKGGAVNPTS